MFNYAFAASVAVALIAGPVAAQKPAETSVDRVRCKQEGETGSLAKVKKVCRKESEWRQLRQASRKEAQEMTQAVNAAPAGN
jgi:hypothetical protein